MAISDEEDLTGIQFDGHYFPRGGGQHQEEDDEWDLMARAPDFNEKSAPKLSINLFNLPKIANAIKQDMENQDVTFEGMLSFESLAMAGIDAAIADLQEPGALHDDLLVLGQAQYLLSITTAGFQATIDPVCVVGNFLETEKSKK